MLSADREESSRRSLLQFLAYAAGLVLVFSSACQRSSRPDNVILVTLDTQRADFVSAYDPANAHTPHIDALARDGSLFRNAYSLIPITLPAHAAIFFSEPPHQVKNYNNGQKIGARRSRPSLANLFRKNGFSTAAFVSLGVLESRYGLDQGFEVYVDNFPAGRWYLSAGEVNAHVLPWLEDNRSRPFFLWVHYSDPHDPYATPDAPNDFKLFLNDRLIYETSLQKYTLNQVTLDLRRGKNELRLEFLNEFDDNPDHFLGRLDLVEFSPPLDRKTLQADFHRGWFIRQPDNVYFFTGRGTIEIDNPADLKQVVFSFRGKPLLSVQAARTCYRREVEYMDREIGRLWDKLGELKLYDRTAVVLVGDHGEGLGEYHNDFGDPHVGHIHFLYDVYMKVPLIIKAPSQSTPGSAREEYVSLLDLAPTITGIMGFKRLPHFLGRDLLRLKKRESLAIFEETFKPEATRDRFGLLSPPWHLIFTPEDTKYEIFNLEQDPRATVNLHAEAKEWPAELRPLKFKLETFAREVLSGKEDVHIDDKTKEMLRALGYIR
jgi:membrane-anchored protein YejM (alkaline phosphatase superfamily)